MKFKSIWRLILCWAFTVATAGDVRFADYFNDQTLRIDYYQTGDAREEWITIDRMQQEPVWAGSTTNLVFPFNYGRYGIKVYDVASNRLIFSYGYDCMFGEYKTTSPALNGVKKSFNRSWRLPMPKRPILLVVEKRDKQNLPHPLFTLQIDPDDYHILRESTSHGDIVMPILQSGSPHDKVDLVFMAEGYTSAEEKKFRSDVEKNVQAMFDLEPYKSNRSNFNIYGVLRPSPESGIDEPREHRYRATALNASFNAFDLDRYVLCDEGIRMRDISSAVPCDAMVILVNSTRYGGGGIFNDYCISTVDNERSRMVFLHEFGHSFGGLADEYYASEVAYNDFYPTGVEPTEPNITALLNPGEIKWQGLVSPGIALPTAYGKDKIDSLNILKQQNGKKRRQELAEAEKRGAAKAVLDQICARYNEQDKLISQDLEAVRNAFQSVEDKVGAFEGAGYSTKGLYRPMKYCLMIYHPKNQFCLVCQHAIQEMIDYYCGKLPAKKW
jgi:hypothetical protein